MTQSSWNPCLDLQYMKPLKVDQPVKLFGKRAYTLHSYTKGISNIRAIKTYISYNGYRVEFELL